MTSEAHPRRHARARPRPLARGRPPPPASMPARWATRIDRGAAGPVRDTVGAVFRASTSSLRLVHALGRPRAAGGLHPPGPPTAISPGFHRSRCRAQPRFLHIKRRACQSPPRMGRRFALVGTHRKNLQTPSSASFVEADPSTAPRNRFLRIVFGSAGPGGGPGPYRPRGRPRRPPRRCTWWYR